MMRQWVKVTGAVGWRKEGIKHKKNEIYLDIIEEVNMVMSSTGQVLRNDVNGKIMIKVFLSGMPDVKLGLNEKLDVRHSAKISWSQRMQSVVANVGHQLHCLSHFRGRAHHLKFSRSCHAHQHLLEIWAHLDFTFPWLPTITADTTFSPLQDHQPEARSGVPESAPINFLARPHACPAQWPVTTFPIHHAPCMQDVSFHQCVNLGRFNTEKVVSFVPPDGEFELMKYRCTENIALPFRVIPVINELGRTRLDVKVAVKSAFSEKLFALNVVITIPMPDNTAKADIQPSQGDAIGRCCVSV